MANSGADSATTSPINISAAQSFPLRIRPGSRFAVASISIVLASRSRVTALKVSTARLKSDTAEARAPVLGDRRYGGPTSLPLDDGRVIAFDRLALHAAHLQVGDVLSATAPVPTKLTEWWHQLGGPPEAWSSAEQLLIAPDRP